MFILFFFVIIKILNRLVVKVWFNIRILHVFIVVEISVDPRSTDLDHLI